MEIFGYTIIKTRELRGMEHEAICNHAEEIGKLKKKIADLEDKVLHQMYDIERANDFKKSALRDKELAESKYKKVCKENRHLEAEIKRLKEYW